MQAKIRADAEQRAARVAAKSPDKKRLVAASVVPEAALQGGAPLAAATRAAAAEASHPLWATAATAASATAPSTPNGSRVVSVACGLAHGFVSHAEGAPPTPFVSYASAPAPSYPSSAPKTLVKRVTISEEHEALKVRT